LNPLRELGLSVFIIQYILYCSIEDLWGKVFYSNNANFVYARILCATYVQGVFEYVHTICLAFVKGKTFFIFICTEYMITTY
jgi:hypothetical protein